MEILRRGTARWPYWIRRFAVAIASVGFGGARSEIEIPDARADVGNPEPLVDVEDLGSEAIIRLTPAQEDTEEEYGCFLARR